MFAQRLRELREKREITHRESGRIITDAAVGVWETGKRIPDSATLQRLADFFAVSVDYLLGRDYADQGTHHGYVARNALPTWLSKLPPEMQQFVKEDAKHGWPYLRLARGLKMQDLSPAELQAIIETWMDAKKKHEREFGK